MDKYKLNENDLTDSQKKIIDKFHFEKTPITETNILESANKLPIDNSIVEEKHERRKKLIGYIDNLVFVYLVFYYKEILQLNNDLEYHIFDYTIQPISPPKNPILDEKNSLQFTLQEKNQNNESKELFLKFFRDIIFVPGKINVCTITDRETNIKFLVHCYHSSKDHLYYLDFQNFKYYIGQNATNIDDKIIKQAVTNIKNSVEKPDDISYAKFPDEFTGSLIKRIRYKSINTEYKSNNIINVIDIIINHEPKDTTLKNNFHEYLENYLKYLPDIDSTYMKNYNFSKNIIYYKIYYSIKYYEFLRKNSKINLKSLKRYFNNQYQYLNNLGYSFYRDYFAEVNIPMFKNSFHNRKSFYEKNFNEKQIICKKYEMNKRINYFIYLINIPYIITTFSNNYMNENAINNLKEKKINYLKNEYNKRLNKLSNDNFHPDKINDYYYREFIDGKSVKIFNEKKLIDSMNNLNNLRNDDSDHSRYLKNSYGIINDFNTERKNIESIYATFGKFMNIYKSQEIKEKDELLKLISEENKKLNSNFEYVYNNLLEIIDKINYIKDTQLYLKKEKNNKIFNSIVIKINDIKTYSKKIVENIIIKSLLCKNIKQYEMKFPEFIIINFDVDYTDVNVNNITHEDIQDIIASIIKWNSQNDRSYVYNVYGRKYELFSVITKSSNKNYIYHNMYDKNFKNIIRNINTNEMPYNLVFTKKY